MLIFLFERGFLGSWRRLIGTSDHYQGGNEGESGGRKLHRMAFPAFNMTTLEKERKKIANSQSRFEGAPIGSSLREVP